MSQPFHGIAHSGALRVDAPPRHAFQLFSPPGEKLWIDGWDRMIREANLEYPLPFATARATSRSVSADR